MQLDGGIAEIKIEIMDGVIFNFMDNKAFYIKFFFLVFGIVLVLLGQYVFPNVKDKSLSDLLSNISFFFRDRYFSVNMVFDKEVTYITY